MFYYALFFFNAIFSGLSDYLKKKKLFFLGIWVSIFSVLPLILVSGFRDSNIGTDRLIYGDGMFKTAIISSNFAQYLGLTKSLDVDLGYQLLNFVISRFTNQLYFFYTVVAIIIFMNFYRGIKIFKKKNDIIGPIANLTLLCFFFPIFQNLIRQSLAISFLFLSISLLIENSYFKSFVYFFIGCLFHRTMIICIIIYGIYIIVSKIQDNKKLLIALIGIPISFFVCVKIFPYLILNFYSVERYSNYISLNSDYSLINTLGIRIPIILLFIIILFKSNFNKKEKRDFVFFLFGIFLFELVFNLMRSMGSNFLRVGFYFQVISIIYLSYLPTLFSDKNKKILIIVIYFYLIIIFLWQTIINHGNQVYPYSSHILENWLLNFGG